MIARRFALASLLAAAAAFAFAGCGMMGMSDDKHGRRDDVPLSGQQRSAAERRAAARAPPRSSSTATSSSGPSRTPA